MAVSDPLRRLIEVNAPLWAGEGEVVRTYFDLPTRTRETDRRWLWVQCRKEFWDSFADPAKGLYLEPLDRLREAFPGIDTEVDRHELLGVARHFVDEFSHYCAFADVYDAIRAEGEPKINPHLLRDRGDLPENAELAAIRAGHRDEYGELGVHACEITEGGYCGLFREGMRLAGRGEVDDLIATACRLVYDDGGKRASVLINLSNDGWFADHEAGRQQHVQIARFRAIENRVALVRAANTGCSVAIDARGFVLETIGEGRYGSGQQPGSLLAQVQAESRHTLFSRVGNLWGWLCLSGTVLMIATSYIGSRG